MTLIAVVVVVALRQLSSNRHLHFDGRIGVVADNLKVTELKLVNVSASRLDLQRGEWSWSARDLVEEKSVREKKCVA